jgi:hypothetical protein
MIDSYKFGEFIIKGKTYKCNVELVGETVKEHRHLDNHELNLDDFTDLINAKPEIIIIGTGAYGVVKPPKEILEFIEKQGIKVIVEKTGTACKTYDSLLKQGKKVAALMHNTC